ncbi:MAG: TetR/AcrR family transcriptional regulator [Phenylobacterium sp.]
MTTAAGRLRIAASAEPVTPDEDGRRRRSQDSRARIVQAMLELVHAGELSPAAEPVATRAKVGLRTVFRHFKDMDSLYQEMSLVIEGELKAIAEQPFKATDWRGRIIEIVHRRAVAYETVGPFLRAVDAFRHRSHVLESDHVRLSIAARAILKRELPVEIVRDRSLFEALDLLLSFEAWSRLRRDQGLTIRRAAEVLEATVRKLLA